MNDIPLAAEFQIGELAASLLDGKLYYKNINSDVLRLGNSFRYLVDFKEFKPVSLGTSTQLGNNYFLRYADSQTLTTSLPFIYLNDIDGINVTTDYLNVNIDSTISSTPLSIPSLRTLSDTNFTLNTTTSNYVVCFNNVAGFISSDYFSNRFFGRWTLQPEASRLLTFDDVGIEGVLTTNYALRTVLDTEQSVKTVLATPFRISYDKNPELSNHLNANSYSIYNQNYNTQFISINDSVSTILLDCDIYDEFIIECNNAVNVLNILGSFTSGYDSQNVKYLSITIRNFDGIIQLPSYVYFENGLAPIIQPGDNVFIGMLYYTNSSPKLILMHKAIGLQKVN